MSESDKKGDQPKSVEERLDALERAAAASQASMMLVIGGCQSITMTQEAVSMALEKAGIECPEPGDPRVLVRLNKRAEEYYRACQKPSPGEG